MSIFEVALESFIDMNQGPVLLSRQIIWASVESEFAEYYCADNGRPSVPIRKMVGMMPLKIIYNLSDKGVVACWLENPYMQYFTGEKVFQKRAVIKPVIGHLKSDHRMIRNFLKGTLGGAINNMMAAAVYNMRHWMNKNALSSFVSWQKTLVDRLEIVILGHENRSACLFPTLVTIM